MAQAHVLIRAQLHVLVQAEHHTRVHVHELAQARFQDHDQQTQDHFLHVHHWDALSARHVEAQVGAVAGLPTEASAQAGVDHERVSI